MNPFSQLEDTVQACIAACHLCHEVCLLTAQDYDPRLSDKPINRNHFRLILSCAEICQTFANFQGNNSPFQARLCQICLEVCEACAVGCERVGGMLACVAACRDCAEKCQKMMICQAIRQIEPECNDIPNFNNWLNVAMAY